MDGNNDSYSNTEHTPLLGGHPRSSKHWSVTHVFLVCLCAVAILFSAKAAIDIEVIQARSEMDRLTPALDRLRHEYTEELVKQQALRQSWSDRLEEMRVETAKEQKKQDVMRQAWREEIARQRDETDKEVERLHRETDEELGRLHRETNEVLEERRRETDEELERLHRETNEVLEERRRETDEELERLHRETNEILEQRRRETAREVEHQEALQRSWQDELAQQRRETAKEVERQEALRRSWQDELAQQRRKTNEELERQEQVRRRWSEEIDRHDAECRQRAEERVREEERRDAEERLNMHLFWDGPHPAEHCWSYGTREYSGRLWNIASGYNWTRACERTPAVINGNSVAAPSWCQTPSAFLGVFGHWLISHGENACEPTWGKFFRKGCSESGKRLIESRLWDVQKGEDAYNLCKTAPATYEGIRYDTPTYCFERERDKAMIAIWEIEDRQC